MSGRRFLFAAAGLLAVAMPLTAQERPREERPRLAPFGWYRFDWPQSLYRYRDPLTRWDQDETRRQMVERALERAQWVRERAERLRFERRFALEDRLRDMQDRLWDRRRTLEERTREMVRERQQAAERLRLRAFDLPRERLLWRPRYRPI